VFYNNGIYKTIRRIVFELAWNKQTDGQADEQQLRLMTPFG